MPLTSDFIEIEDRTIRVDNNQHNVMLYIGEHVFVQLSKDNVGHLIELLKNQLTQLI